MIRLFRILVPARVAALLASDFIVLCACFLAAAFLVLRVDPQVFLTFDNGWLRIGLVAVCLMLGIYFHDLYSHFRVRSRLLLYQQVGMAVGVAFLIQALLGYLRLRQLILPTGIMIAGSAISILALPAWRVLYSGVVIQALGHERVLFLGTSSLVQEIGAHLTEHPENGMAVLGFVDDGFEDLHSLVRRLRPDRIVVGLAERRGRLPVHQLLELRLAGIHIEEAMSAYEAVFQRIPTRELRPSQLIFSSTELGPKPSRVLLQSVYSRVIAIVAVIVFAPVMLVVAILVKLSSPGTVLLRQQRVGQNDRVFTLYKFRSMYRDAEATSGAVWARQHDPRITPVGKWLRKLRFDELPQLFNVLRGEMSIVGPRPERPEFVTELERQIPYYRLRHCIKPGITGWAQIKHKYGDTLEDTKAKLEYDLYYIKNLAPLRDAVIMFHTAKVMLLGRGSQ